MGETTAAIAARQPEHDFLAIDVHAPGVGSLLRLIDREQLANVRIVTHDAVDVVQQMIAPRALAAVHVFFPTHGRKNGITSGACSNLHSCMPLPSALHPAAICTRPPTGRITRSTCSQHSAASRCSPIP